jgi:CheY-like chemotaxis protein
MATVLIVEDDGLVAGRMVQMLRKADHTPVRASDARSALREALAHPDVILLDLRLPDLPGQEILRRLRSRPETADIPVVVITGCAAAAKALERDEPGQVAQVLLKPVSEPQLCQAVDDVLAGRQDMPISDCRMAQHRQRELVRRLIVEGPDRLAFHVYRRLCADRSGAEQTASVAEVLGWAEIAEWARLEGLLDAEQAALLCSMAPANGRDVAGGCA